MGHNPHSYIIGDDPTLASAETNDIWEDPFLSAANIPSRNDHSALPRPTGNIAGVYTADEPHPSYLHVSLSTYTPNILDKLPGSNQPLGLTPWATPWEGKGTSQFLEELYVSQSFYNTSDDDIESAPVPGLTRSPASSAQTLPTTPTTPTTSTTSSPRSRQKSKRRLSSHKAPSPPIKFVHDELSMPANFQANPNAHARFKYHDDGTREYLNSPRKRQKLSSI
jgi:hypothetical protein